MEEVIEAPGAPKMTSSPNSGATTTLARRFALCGSTHDISIIMIGTSMMAPPRRKSASVTSTLL